MLGAGQNRATRLYRLTCGHEQLVATAKMRQGGFRCQTCMAEKLNQEAEAQGCKLLGPGRDANYRLYLLPCGHEQEIHTAGMRKGGIRCSSCLEDRLRREAQVQGCKLLGSADNPRYRKYQLPCGHEQEVHTYAMREGAVQCKICLYDKLEQEAAENGCVLLGPGKDTNYRVYRLRCGHEQELAPTSVRKGSFRCHTCLDNKLNQEAKEKGCELLGRGRSKAYRYYRLPCGHEQEVQTGDVRRGDFDCKVCRSEKLKQEAEEQGCKLLGSGKKNNYRLYRLPCGHDQEVQTGDMRRGNFLCQICEETSRSLPSNLYLLHIKVDSDEWLKLGYAKSVDNRVTRYGLPEAALVKVVKSVPFETGNEAHAIEADIHKRYRRKRLPREQVEFFHTRGGFDECYPITMLETLLAEFEALKQDQPR